MSKNSSIEWTHHTFNPWWGCVKVSAACDHCYAAAWANRLGHDVWGPHSERRILSDDTWKQPIKWNRDAAASQVRQRVFCASMGDVFENRKDLIPHRMRLFELIDATPNLDWLLLTKRIHLVKKLLPKGYELPANVWLGATVENQEVADKMIRYLLEFESPSVRFLSCEPLLGPIDLGAFLNRPEGSPSLDWVIAGGESGFGARPMDPAWPLALQEQCAEAGVAFHFKQWGNWAPVSLVPSLIKKSTQIQVFGNGESEVSVANIGKGNAGRTLAGQHWDEFPETRTENETV
ncbi:phage Gp37/Gp68 family protein [Polaromonas sp.]|uniref:phage Gp37/Gp68 family protein n=1 Tax=Polaromonas sp. TaxID=1869339 RepID=UPI003BAB965C